MLYVGRPTDDMSLSYTDVIRQLAMVTDDVTALTDSHSSTVDTCSFIDCLRIVIYFFYVLRVRINHNNDSIQRRSRQRPTTADTRNYS